MLRVASILLPILAASPCLAAVVECPLRHPVDQHQILVGGENEDGDRLSGKETRRGDIRHYTEYLEKWGERNTKLICRYRAQEGGGGELILAVPGRLVRCDWLAQEVLKPQPVEPDTGGPIEQIYLRIWCTSKP